MTTSNNATSSVKFHLASCTNAELALALASAGIPVFPCADRATKRLKVKAPLTANGFKDRTADLREVERWWKKWPNALVGLVPGDVGAAVIDLDVKGKHNGVDAFRALVLHWRDLPAVLTPSGGEHIWVAAPAGELGNGAGSLPKGIDIRCDHGYVCLGVLADGAHYEDLGGVLETLLDSEAAWPAMPKAVRTALKAAPAATASATRHDYTADSYSDAYRPVGLAELRKHAPSLRKWEDGAGRSEDAYRWLLAAVAGMCQVLEKDAREFGDDETKNLCELAIETEHDFLGHYLDGGGWAKLGYDAEAAVEQSAGEYGTGFDVHKKVKSEKKAKAREDRLPEGAQLEDFVAYLPDGSYCFLPTRGFWPANSVNAVIPAQGTYETDDGKEKPLKAHMWLNRNAPVHLMTWAPGLPKIIEDRLFVDGMWQDRPLCNVLNLYRPPTIEHGDPRDVGPWLNHLKRVYAGDWQHIVYCMAHRVQRPAEKINHALVLGGNPRIGKDTILEPLKYAVGASNFAEVAPDTVAGSFNSYMKSVVLRISEARDLGDISRYAFYEKTKTIIAAPPDTATINEKHMKPYDVPNVAFVVITTNYKIGGLYLPLDDGRHYVAWCDETREDFTDEYFSDIWNFYDLGGSKQGIKNVVAYLATLDLSKFNAKAPPKKTKAFYDMAESHIAEDEGDIADALENLEYPTVVTANMLIAENQNLQPVLKDAKNTRRIASVLDRYGYIKIANPYAQSGKWRISKDKLVVYGRKEMSFRQHSDAIKRLV